MWMAGASGSGGGTSSVSTAGWGCGTFGGDFGLKFCVQWLAAGLAGFEVLVWETGFNGFEGTAPRGGAAGWGRGGALGAPAGSAGVP